MSRYDEILDLAQNHAYEITKTPEDWMGYLDAASKQYQYPFIDMLLIHAQRPDATVCAGMNDWNSRIHRWINPGAKGIALFDRRGGQKGVRYVFDMVDTHPVTGAVEPVIWRFETGHEAELLAHLKDEYNLSGEETAALADAIPRIADILTDEVIADTFAHMLERFPDLAKLDSSDELEEKMYSLIAGSMEYLILSRCGMDPRASLSTDDFSDISMIGSPYMTAYIGGVVQKKVKAALDDIGQVVLGLENDRGTERNTERSRENDTEEITGSKEETNEHSISGGISGERDNNGQVLAHEGDISVTQQGTAVSGTAPERGTGLSPDGDGEERAEEDGGPDGGIPEAVPGSAEDGAHQVDGTHEQSRGDGGGDSTARDDLRLNTSVIPLGVIDTVLRDGTDRDNGKIRIIFDYMIDKPEESHVRFVRNEYGTGGKGFIINGQEVSVWFNKEGMRIAFGRTVYTDADHYVDLTWPQVSRRIHELLENGEYAAQQEIQEAKDNALRDAAAIPVNISSFFKNVEAVKVFDDIVPKEGRYQDKVEAVMQRLSDNEFAASVVDSIASFNEMTRGSKYVVIYEWYKPVKAISEFTRLTMEPKHLEAKPGIGEERAQVFITDDEISYFLCSAYSSSKYDAYLFFRQRTAADERARYLRGSFGFEKSDNTLAGYSHFGYSSDGSGLTLYKNGSGPVGAMREFTWTEAAERVGDLIDQKRFFTRKEYEGLSDYERDYIAGMVVKFYAYLPGYIKRPFDGVNTDIMRGRISVMIMDSVEAHRLYGKMVQDLSIVLIEHDASDPWSDERVIILQKFKAYIDGEYTIFEPDRFIPGIKEHTEETTKENLRPVDPETGYDAVAEDPDKHQIVQGDNEPEEIIEKAVAEEFPPATDVSNAVTTEMVVAEPGNFRITNMELGEGGPKQKCQANLDAIRCLKQIEAEGRLATADEQVILSGYAGWGGIPQVFDESNADWSGEYGELRLLLTEDEYKAARRSTLSAFYTPPVVINAMYKALASMGLKEGNVLEPSCGIGNFMGLIPESMDAVNMYGVELDSISGRIARQLYQRNDIMVQGFEKTALQDNFFDTVIGNVPFGNFQLADPAYDRHHFLIHDYFIARSIDLVRPGGVIAVVTSSGTMDKADEKARRYFAQRADLLGAIRLPDTAFQRNANTNAVADILFFQKRDRTALEVPEWVHTSEMKGFSINSFFLTHPEMVLGEIAVESGQYGDQMTVRPKEGVALSELLEAAVGKIHGTIPENAAPEMTEAPDLRSMPATPDVANFSYTTVDGDIFFRENSEMYEQILPAKTTERIKGMVELRDITRKLLRAQLEDYGDDVIHAIQGELDEAYERFTKKNGLISSTANKRAFSQDSGYCLISALEILNENGELERKADIFTKRTIRKAEAVTSVDTASEALTVSIGEKAGVDLDYMASLTGMDKEAIAEELRGVIFLNPLTDKYETADEYLSGNVRRKLRTAQDFAENDTRFNVNVEALIQVQPKDLDATEIEVRLGAPWVKQEYVQQFMEELFEIPEYIARRGTITVNYSEAASVWGITGKTEDRSTRVTSTYGTGRASAYRLLEDALNLRDTKIYDTVPDADGNEKRVINAKETALAQQKQEMIRQEFRTWIFKDIERREDICKTYNEIFNSVRPREYDGSHIRFYGMNPEITLLPHQKNAIAHVLYGKNTLLAHCVGSGKTFEVTAAAMESKRLGLCRKSLIVVPNHLTEQWGSEFMRLYPGAKILVATKKDFEPANRKKFCSRIATGDYDAVIIGHSQFEKIPLSVERRAAFIQNQIDDLQEAIEEAEKDNGTRFTIKQLEKLRNNLETTLERLTNTERKDDVVTFEELGVDRLFVDESQNFKNLYLYTKMHNVAGISQTDAQKSSDMFMKCRYMDEITGGRGVTFATGTPISNSMVEMYTLMRYLQYDTLSEMGLMNFDSWAATFGETVNSIELSPEGTGYRSKTRFARFFNLPELMSVFREAADVQTEDMLDLPVPEPESITEVIHPSEMQKQMVESFGERAEKVRAGRVNPAKDNMLKITNDGRKCALDQRLLNPDLPDESESKVNRCVENVFSIWTETKAERSTQLIFSDLSTPTTDGSFNVYDDIRNKLVAKGVPKEEVAFIHEYNTETKKAALFAKVRSGQVRVLIGSTQKLGAGTNVQDRLIALHHLDCPWRPSDLQQQNGRILRQGNMNPKVKIFQYVTEQTFDSYMWQILEQKQKFISQIMTSRSPVRTCDDVDDAALSYAEIKALATGNPLIKEKMELDIEMTKLKLLRSNYISEKYRLESDIAHKYPAMIKATTERIEGMKTDMRSVEAFITSEKEEFTMMVGDRIFTDRKEAGEALIAACKSAGDKREGAVIGDYHGFELSARYEYIRNAYMVSIRGECTYQAELGQNAVGNMTRIRNALVAIPKELEKEKQRLEKLQNDLAVSKEEVEKPFPMEDEYQQKQERLNELDAMLSLDVREDATQKESQQNEQSRSKSQLHRDENYPEGVPAQQKKWVAEKPSLLGRLREKQQIAKGKNKLLDQRTHTMDVL